MQPGPSQPPASDERRFRLIVWIVMFMFMSIPMYYVMMRMVPPDVADADSNFPAILMPLSVVTMGLSIPIRRLVARTKPRIAFVLGLILCEAAALFGVVAWFATGSPRSYYCLATGVMGMLLHFPRAAHSNVNPE
jgi:hypothetical protein